MAFASAPPSTDAPHAGLAVRTPRVVRSGVALQTTADPAASRERAKMRLYVLCQFGGWGFFLLLQLAFSQFFSGARGAGRDSLGLAAALVMVAAMGLLLTHYTRPLLTRWGWKQLGWRPLVPRVLATAAVLSCLWSVLGYGYTYGLLGTPWPSKYGPALLLGVSWINGATLLIGWLCLYFFYHLFDRYNRLEVEQLRLARSVKEAELRALKSQVNPHFLFNSLNSLRALIDEDPPRAREAVTRMANLLRYSLQSGQLETVALEDELRTVEDYLALEQIRHEDRLRVRFDIAPDVRALSLPPMLLQTLVENAVKYGISPRRDGGEIVVSARCADGALRLRVTNPGELAANGNSTGLGLKNAAERLQLLFGSRAVLELRADAPGLVAADVIIPLPPVHESP